MNGLIGQCIDLLSQIKEGIGDQDRNFNDEQLLKTKENIRSEIAPLIVSLEGLLSLDVSTSSQLGSLIINTIEMNKNNLDSQYTAEVSKVEIYQKYLGILANLTRLKNELKRINYLSVIGDKNVVIVGGNGVGKSAFAAYLRETQSEEIVVIPAQKLLYYDGKVYNLLMETKSSINDTQKRNLIGEGKNLGNSRNQDVSRYQNDLVGLFSKLITAIVNEQIAEEHTAFQSLAQHEQSNNITILDQLKEVWGNLIPDIEFEINTTHRTLIPKKHGVTYNINSMSDGEKAILFYISQVLLAKENSYIIIDEPETYLNTSTYSRLWDNLERVRSDCRFIYISHNIDFIVTRSNIDLMWCQDYTYPNDWTLKRINEDDEVSKKFPKQLLTEILGVRKSILFCEGTKEGLDFSVYNTLFNNEYIVCPVGGHSSVIQYTRAYNASPTLNGNQAYGLIDGDWMEDEQIDKYKTEGIYSLPFNEIEMLLMTDEVMVSVLEYFHDQKEIDAKIAIFKEELFKKIAVNKDKTINIKIKKYLDYRLSRFRINDKFDQDNYENQIVGWIKSLKIEEIRNNNYLLLEKILKNRQYPELLKVCSQKKEISKELANKYLDSDYELKAQSRMKLSSTLRQELKEKYFSNLL